MYTHYFTQKRSFTDKEWDTIIAGAEEIIDYCTNVANIKLVQEENTDAKPILDSTTILFNGAGDLGHESFYLNKYIKFECFQFCKTARKPYDLAVCLILLRVEAIAPGALAISSDGDEEWNFPRSIYKELFKQEDPTI